MNSVISDGAVTKMHGLCVYYSATRSKAIASQKKSGFGAGDALKVYWPYYEMFFFLSDNVTPRSSILNLDDRIVFTDTESYYGSPASAYSTENIPIFNKKLNPNFLMLAMVRIGGNNAVIDTTTEILKDITQAIFQRRINVVLTLWINVETTLIRRWNWNKTRRWFINVVQRLYNVGLRRWNNFKTMFHNVETTSKQRCITLKQHRNNFD